LILFFTLGNVPGPIPPLLVPFFYYMIFSFVPPIIIIISCVIGLIRGKGKYVNIMCLIISIIYDVIFFSFIRLMWRQWMGV
jgi:hypothetical protein